MGASTRSMELLSLALLQDHYSRSLSLITARVTLLWDLERGSVVLDIC